MIYNKKITNNKNCKAVSQIMTAVHAVVKSDKEVPEAYKVSGDFYIAHPYIYSVDAHEWEWYTKPKHAAHECYKGSSNFGERLQGKYSFTRVHQ